MSNSIYNKILYLKYLKTMQFYKPNTRILIGLLFAIQCLFIRQLQAQESLGNQSTIGQDKQQNGNRNEPPKTLSDPEGKRRGGSFGIQGIGKVLNANGMSESGASISIYTPKEIGLIGRPYDPNKPEKYTLVQTILSDSLGIYQVTMGFKIFVPEGKDFMWLRNEIQDSASTSFYFLVEARSKTNALGFIWVNLKEKITMNQMPPPQGGFKFIIPDLVLIGKAETLVPVEVKTPSVIIKGDTTEINAANFKVNPDASAEDLVAKMPGIANSNGQVQAQGEQVKKVLVDGKPFFGEDPSAALKNLPAEVVSKIQIFDAKSEQSLFSGIEDGNTTKTMNIVTKSQFRNGSFGRGFLGYGQGVKGSNDIHKFKSGISVNVFSGNRRISLLSQMNNINEQNFSFEDIVGSMGGGNRSGNSGGGNRWGMAGMGGMGGMGNFFVGTQNGITTTRAIGLNYSDQWGKKIEVSGSYFVNSTDNLNSTKTSRTYILSSQSGNPIERGGILYNEENPSRTDNYSHRLNLRVNWKIDSSNSLLVEPKFSLQENISRNPVSAITLASEGSSIGSQLQEIGKLVNNTHTETTGYRFSSNFLWRHNFEKKGRTISMEIVPGVNAQNGFSLLQNSNIIQKKDTSARDQRTGIDKLTQTLSGNITLTEGLDSTHFIAGTLATSINENNNDRSAYQYDLAQLGYTRLDTFFSSKFANGYASHKIGLSYRIQNYKWNITASLDGQLAFLKGNQTYPKTQILNRQFGSILPGFQLRYNMGAKRNLRFSYSTSNNAPSIDQLQPVINNSNPMQLSSGNPMLVQDYQHSVFVRYFSVKPEIGKNLFLMLNSQYSNNYMSNKTILALRDTLVIPLNSSTYGGNSTNDPTIYNGNDSVPLLVGSQLTLPVNINGYYSIRAYGAWSRTIKKINMSLNGGANISHIPSLIQMGNTKALTNIATNPTSNLGLSIASNISERMDFTLNGNVAYNQVINSIQKNNNQTYMNYTSRVAINWMPSKKWVMNSDITYQAYTGLSRSFNQQFYLWNAGIGYKFMKGNAGELRVTAYDILNQNRSIQRTVSQAYYEDVKTQVLTRYLMLTFTYKLRKFNSKEADGKDMKMMFPGGMPPPGYPGHGMPRTGGGN